MKKVTTLALLLTLSACGGYENLNTPFNFRGKGLNLFGTNAEPVSANNNQFEVGVNAPAGMTEATAMQLFDQEASRVCGGREYTKQITATGLSNVREYGVKGVDTAAPSFNAPSIRGVVTCK